MIQPSASSACPRLPPCGSYAVTDGLRDDLIEVARAALEGGAVILQYRDKSHDAERRLREARGFVALCKPFRVPMIVNDDAALARGSGAGGGHVGAKDPDLAAARRAGLRRHHRRVVPRLAAARA